MANHKFHALRRENPGDRGVGIWDLVFGIFYWDLPPRGRYICRPKLPVWLLPE